LDYARLRKYPGTHAYFRDWIAFRRGPLGDLLRRYSLPSDGYFQFFHPAGGGAAAVAALVNADLSGGDHRLLFAVNPTNSDATIPIGDTISFSRVWRQIADNERFYSASEGLDALSPVDTSLFVPALGCGLWLGES
jgi:hypothetical protein